jgi:hypothetical protein
MQDFSTFTKKLGGPTTVQRRLAHSWNPFPNRRSSGTSHKHQPPWYFDWDRLATITLILHSKFKNKSERLSYFPGSPDEPDLVRSTGLSGSELAVYTTNMATPAMNIATVVIAATVHPKRELGWPCISFLSEATTSILPRRKGANSPLMTADQ